MMMKTLKKTLLFALLISLFINVKAQTVDSEKILLCYQQFLLASSKVDLDSVAKWSSALAEDGRWNDIDYPNNRRSSWPAVGHLDRIRNLSLAWANPKSDYYKQPKLWEVISNAIKHWSQMRYQNPNWWYNEIGVPQYWKDIIVLTRSRLEQDQLKSVIELLGQYRIKGTGANLIWSADLALHTGALTNDHILIKKCSNIIHKEIKIGKGDGIQTDYSYHQHGARLQTYHYGSAFLKDNIRLAWQLEGTAWAFPAEKIEILSLFVLNGWQWMARGINTIPSTLDRSVTRKGTLKNADLRGYLPYLIQLSPKYANELKDVLLSQNDNKPSFEGFRHYPYSDFSVHQQKGFSFFLKTISSRTLSTEKINSENIKGEFLNFGDSYFIKEGNEYFDLMPVWDWKKLPGITNFEGAFNIERTPFTGGVSNNKYGATAMNVKSLNGDTVLSGYKFWASYKNVMVCLMAKFTLSNGADDVYTVLNQSRWSGPVTLNKPGNILNEGTYQFNNIGWLHHAGFVYILEKNSSLSLELKSANGKWSDINSSGSTETITEKTFIPVIHHAKFFSTHYVVGYAETAVTAKKLAQKPFWKTIANDKNCQAVSFEKKLLMVVFREKGNITDEKGNKISADRPCIFLYEDQKLIIADPLHIGGAINLEINGMKQNINLPANGSSIAVDFQKK